MANAVLLGDFNVFTTNDATFKAIEKADFEIPAGLKSIRTPIWTTVDQMAFLAPDVKSQVSVAKAGVFPFSTRCTYDDQATYLPDAKTYREWRTHKMSDHLPIWVELRWISAPTIQRKLLPVP
jgi:endonuclease/exonuclease/phosphatase family metal-dependent hydrolase